MATLVRLLLVLVVAAGIPACGGGGSGFEPGTISGIAQDARVSILMTESSDGEEAGAYIKFSKVVLVPKDGGDNVTLYEDVAGKEVNFSNLNDEDLLFSVAEDVPTGTYSKLLLTVLEVRVVGSACEDLTTSVPGDEIELVPDEDIEIAAGDEIALRLAMDSEKSVQIEVNGDLGTCTFDPVVSVSAQTISPAVRQDCPTSVSGTVTDLELNIGLDVIGFTLDLGGEAGTQRVMLAEGSGIFGANGLPMSTNGIGLDDEVTAKGRLDGDGDMTADVVVVGSTITFDAVVVKTPKEGVFVVEPDEGEAVVGETAVRLFPGTLILFDCQDATPDSLTEGAHVTITGKVAPDKQIFRASDVEVDPVVVLGDMTSCTDVTGGREITVLPVGVAVETTILVPDGVKIQLQGDGEVPDDLLKTLLDCEPLPVRVSLDKDATGDTPEASKVEVAAETIVGLVTAVDAIAGELTIGDKLIDVLDTATIIDLREGEDLGDLGDIEIGDRVRVFGLAACEDAAVHFHAFVVLILDEKPDRPEPPKVYEGCGLGFWKNHTGAWPDAYSPHTLFGDVFENVFPGKTLLDVLRQGGGGIKSLGRHSVAALLNAASAKVHYRYSVAQVVHRFDEAAPHGSIEHVKKDFEYNNELGCPLGGHDKGEGSDERD